jgi:hypothetical protein
MLGPQIIVNLLHQRSQQAALRTGRVGCRNVVSSVSHMALTSTTVSMRALKPKSDAAVTFAASAGPQRQLLFAKTRISGKGSGCL